METVTTDEIPVFDGLLEKIERTTFIRKVEYDERAWKLIAEDRVKETIERIHVGIDVYIVRSFCPVCRYLTMTLGVGRGYHACSYLDEEGIQRTCPAKLACMDYAMIMKDYRSNIASPPSSWIFKRILVRRLKRHIRRLKAGELDERIR